MDYTQRLRDLRADHDMSQAAIAAAIGIDQKQYSRYETGINELPLRYLVKLCQVYQVSADYLLGLPRGLSRTTRCWPCGPGWRSWRPRRRRPGQSGTGWNTSTDARA